MQPLSTLPQLVLAWLEQARQKVPKKTVKIKERVVDPVTGKRKTRL